MQYGVWHVERRDGADRDEFAQAALAFCRVVRALDGVEDCRFYWKPYDIIVIQAQGKSSDAWNVTDADLAKASFDLYDLGRAAGYEEWLDAKSGQEAYVAAGR